MANLNRNRRALLALTLAGAGSLPTAAFAADTSERPGLDPDFPVRVEDAYPSKCGDAYLKLSSRYSDLPTGVDQTLIQPELAWGFAPNLDVHISSPIFISNSEASRTGSGDVNANVQWLFHDQHEGEWIPAMAVEGDLIFPTGGQNNTGLDTTVQFIATETLYWAPSFDSIHLNLTWMRNADAAPLQREVAYNAILGYSRRIAPETVLIADVLWEETFVKHAAGETAEIGVIQKLGDHIQLAAGVGIGLGDDDAANYTATVGIIISK